MQSSPFGTPFSLGSTPQARSPEAPIFSGPLVASDESRDVAEQAAEMLAMAQCGSKAFYVVKGRAGSGASVLSYRSIKHSVGRKVQVGQASVAELDELHCFPLLPEFKSPIIRCQADRKQSTLAIVTFDKIAIVRLKEEVSAANILYGIVEKQKEGDSWHVKLQSMSGPKFTLVGSLTASTLEGSIEELDDVGRRSGRLNFKPKGGHVVRQDGCPLAQGDSWAGSCKLHRSGEVALEAVARLEVLSVSASGTPGQFRVQCTLGGARVELLNHSLYASDPDPVVDARWHPVLEDQLVVLTRAGNLRVYGTRAFDWLDAPIISQRILLGECAGFECVGMSFGATLACRDRPQECGFRALIRRSSLYVLCSNGAIICSSPVGALDRSLVELGHFKEALGGGNTPELQKQREWVDLLEQKAENDKVEAVLFQPALFCLPAQSPSQRRGLNARRSRACSLAVLPETNRPHVTLLRAWTCGHIESLFGGSPPLPRLCGDDGGQSSTSKSQQQQQQQQQQRNGNYSSPRPGSVTRAMGGPSRRDSPLRNLSSKIESHLRTGGSGTKENEMSRKNSFWQSGVREDQEELLVPGSRPPAVGDMLHCQVAPRLVGCSEVVLDSPLLIETNPVFADMCMCVAQRSGAVYLLYAPWTKGRLNNAGRLLFRCIPQVCVPTRHLGAIAVIVEPGVGHLLCGGHDSAPSAVACADLNDFCIQIQSEFAVLEGSEQRGPNGKLITNGADSEEEEEVDADGDSYSSEDEVDELNELQKHFSNQLARLSRIPPELARVKVLARETPPALSLALTSWLHELADSLLYGRQGNAKANGAGDPTTGLLQNIAMGMELIEQRRINQIKTFEMQQKALRLVEKEIQAARDGLDAAAAMSDQVVELQQLSEESLDAAKEQSASIRVPSSEAEKRFGDFVNDMEERTNRLARRVGGVEGSACSPEADGQNLFTLAKMLDKSEAAAVAERNDGDGAPVFRWGNQKSDIEQQAAVKDLQERTQTLLARMLECKDVAAAQSTSLFNVQSRLMKLRESILSGGGSMPTSEDALVVLLVAESEASDMLLQHFGQAAEQASICVDKEILDRTFQNDMRRRVGVDAIDCPYYVKLACEQGPLKNAQLHLVLMDDAISVYENDGGSLCVSLIGRYQSSTSEKLRRVTPVVLQRADAEIAPVTTFQDQWDLREACGKVSILAEDRATKAFKPRAVQ